MQGHHHADVYKLWDTQTHPNLYVKITKNAVYTVKDDHLCTIIDIHSFMSFGNKSIEITTTFSTTLPMIFHLK